MAQAVAVDTWSARGVRMTEVVSALADLRHHASDHSATRTAVMTLVAVTTTEDQFNTATNVLHALGGHHPARIVLIRPDPDEAAHLDAQASLYTAEAHGHRMNFEEVSLHVGGQAALHLDSLVEALTVADLPVTVWYAGALPQTTDSLLGIASALIVDSRDLGDVSTLTQLRDLVRRKTVVDLSWIRLQAWRELLAGLFDPPSQRVFLTGVDNAQVQGKSGPRRLIGGWLASQLRLKPEQLSLVDARHVQVTLECHYGNESGTFDVGRMEGRRVVWAGSTVSTGPSLRQILPLADDPLPASLAHALTHLDPDPLWERALGAGVALGPSSGD